MSILRHLKTVAFGLEIDSRVGNFGDGGSRFKDPAAARTAYNARMDRLDAIRLLKALAPQVQNLAYQWTALGLTR